MKTTIDMARESWIDVYGLGHDRAKFIDALKHFEALVRADERAAPVQELQRYSPNGEGGMEVDSLGAYVKHQDVTTPPAQPAQCKPLTDKQSAEMWLQITLEPCTHEATYLRGIKDAEAAHGIATPPAAQRTWVGSGDLEDSNAYQTPPAQPAVPDAITDTSESPEYIQGWNDCRFLMLKSHTLK